MKACRSALTLAQNQVVKDGIFVFMSTFLFQGTDAVMHWYVILGSGVDTIAADFKEQKLTITGEMDIIAIAKRLKKFGKFEVASVETGEEQKEQNEGKK